MVNAMAASSDSYRLEMCYFVYVVVSNSIATLLYSYQLASIHLCLFCAVFAYNDSMVALH